MPSLNAIRWQLMRIAGVQRECENIEKSLKGSNITAQGIALGQEVKSLNDAIRAVIEKL